jgi:hypothetical protein
MPSPFFCNFLQEDLNSFSRFAEGRPPGFGYFDHWWPSDLLINGRFRFIGSSDIACMLEITEPHKNVPPWNEPTDPPDEFMHERLQNLYLKQFVSCFRSQFEQF